MGASNPERATRGDRPDASPIGMAEVTRILDAPLRDLGMIKGSTSGSCGR